MYICSIKQVWKTCKILKTKAVGDTKLPPSIVDGFFIKKNMNTSQRKFLIERIQKKTKDAIELLKGQMIAYPSASNYIFKAILSNDLELQPREKTLEAIKYKAISAKEGSLTLIGTKLKLIN